MLSTKIIYFDELTSTNIKLRELAESGAGNGTVIRAGAQTKGRGRTGRAWDSKSGEGLFMSILLRPGKKVKSAQLLTQITGLGVCFTAEHFMRKDVQIKWPNDVICGGRKLSGILIETVFVGAGIDYMIVGIGVNVNNTGFLGELKTKASSFFIESGEHFVIDDVAAKLTAELDILYENFFNDDLSFLPEYKKRCANIGRTVKLEFENAELLGTAEDISEVGELIVKTSEGNIICVNAGEVSVRGIDGYI